MRFTLAQALFITNPRITFMQDAAAANLRDAAAHGKTASMFAITCDCDYDARMAYEMAKVAFRFAERAGFWACLKPEDVQ